MGTILRKQYTMPLPAGAEIVECAGQKIARWRLRNGQARSAEVVGCQDGIVRVRGQSKSYMARYRDGAGRMVEVATGCRDAVAARRVLTELERRAELVRAGVITEAEDLAVEHAEVPLSKHFDAYEKHLQAKGCDSRRVSMVRARLDRLGKDCKFTRLSSMAVGPVEDWLLEHANLAAATRNGYRESLVGFGNWCRRTRRLTNNPFQDLPRADGNVNRKHQRRALTEEELEHLLKVARLRPLAGFGRKVVHNEDQTGQSARSRATWKRQPISMDDIDAAVGRARKALSANPLFVARLEALGRARELMYKTFLLSGLRKRELASLTVGQLELKGPVAYAVLNPADEKNRKGCNIPLRADIAADLSVWLNDRLVETQNSAHKEGAPIPARLPGSTPLFEVPSGLCRILDRDLAAAGIPKRDERNRVVDVHALRVTFGTHLCAAGVPLRTAQAAMRHSKPELTANIYTDPKFLDIAGAINALPSLASDTESKRFATS
jgi:integrase